MPSSEWLAERADITARISLRKGVRQRVSPDGQIWLDHFCLFHDDHHRSATWKEESGTYYCRTCDKSYLVPRVLEALNMRRETKRATIQHQRQAPEKIPDHIYTYLFPDGRPSHMKWRWDQPKRFIQVGIDGEPGLPADSWPLYGDQGLAEGLHIFVVEGEKKVDRAVELDDRLDQVSIRALTAGSAADLRNHAVEIAARLGELKPKSICLWPDNDETGLAAMRSVHSALQKQGIAHAVIQPAALGLPLKGDLVDYVQAGNSLASLVARQTGTLESEPVTALVAKSIVVAGSLIWGREIHAISEDNARAIWYEEYRALPTQRQLQEFLALLRIKARTDSVVVSPRAYTNEQVTWWRPNSGPAIQISAKGLSLSEDPPGVFLLTPDDGRHVDASVDLDGSARDLEALISPWELTDTEIAMITGWLVCAMGGLQTPILFMKSPAGTGKTTLARFLLSVIEPMCPEIRPRQLSDERHFALGLMKYPVALIDNASRVDSAVEDTLSQLVTGYTASIRPLYSDTEKAMFLRRGIIVTTTNWDVYKGDLASRMVVVQPTPRGQGHADDRSMQRRFMPLIPKVRGYVMSLLAIYYQRRAEFPENTHFRIGDLGVVFATLGYDSEMLAHDESMARAEVVSGNDPWLEAMVEMWKDEASVSYMKTTLEVLRWMTDYGCQNVPAEKSPKLARWFAEKSPFFLDYGFQVERVMNNPRGYRFKRIESASH